LEGKKILVQIDNWPQDSHYPRGHYIKIIGNDGDRKVFIKTSILIDISHLHKIFLIVLDRR